jgi:hypothetical protein
MGFIITSAANSKAFVKVALVVALLPAFPALGQTAKHDGQQAVITVTAQAELSRLGCYQMKVDGRWGHGSRTALSNYYAAKRVKPGALVPSAALVEKLKSESRLICNTSTTARKVTNPQVDSARAAEYRLNKSDAKALHKASLSAVRREGLLKSLLSPGSF